MKHDTYLKVVLGEWNAATAVPLYRSTSKAVQSIRDWISSWMLKEIIIMFSCTDLIESSFGFVVREGIQVRMYMQNLGQRMKYMTRQKFS